MQKYRRLWDTYRFPCFRPKSTVQGVFGDPKARIVCLHRRGKKRFAVPAAIPSEGGTTANDAGLNNKIRVIQRRSYGLRDEEYLRLKILTCMLPQI
jgi:Transposase